jgi:tRNA modification GTPase
MFSEDTIAAISTPPGYSGIGIVRLSGRDAIKIADRVFCSRRNRRLSDTPSHRILYGHIFNPSDKETLDEVLVSIMKSPNTYTREDIVEINCHGGPVTLKRTLEILLDSGARLAEPGEFTKRAFLNGRIDLPQSEAVLDIINSLTEQSSKAAIEQLRGGLSDKIEAIRSNLINLTAIVEAYIDFPEEEIEPPAMQKLDKTASEVLQELNLLIKQARFGRVLREGLKTAIIGRPNVGKSSLLNALLEQDRVIVNETPGTTRDIIEEYLNINGIPVRIMDTAGIRESNDLVEKEGVQRSLRAMKEADLTLLVINGSEQLHETDMELINKSGTEKSIIVINKTDLPSKVPTDSFTDCTVVRISALRKTGLEKLKSGIAGKSLKGEEFSGRTLVTNIRHVRALEKAQTSITSFITHLTELPPELLSIDLRETLDALGEVVGVTTTEEILDRIFREFCVGK